MLAIIPNTNVVDVANRRIHIGHDVIFEDGIIVELRPAKQAGDGWRVLSGGPERWVMPGLIDAHVHLLEIYEGPDAGRLPDEALERALQRGVENVNVALSAGITTLRDAGAFQARNNILRNTVNIMPVPLARILSCGHHITVEGGHFWDRGVAWNRVAPIENLVETEISEGADFIKVMNDGRIFDDRELKAIVTAAHKLGKRVACHAYTEGQILQAIKCAVDTIEHGFPASPAITQSLRDSGTTICPTIVAAVDSVRCVGDKKMLEAFPDCTAQEFIEWHANVSQHLQTAFANNLPVIAGTDAGIIPTPFNSIHRELELFRSHGGSSWDTLRSATILAAAALGIDALTGQITPRRSADLLILARDPVADLAAALQHIECVLFQGNVVWKNHA